MGWGDNVSHGFGTVQLDGTGRSTVEWGCKLLAMVISHARIQKVLSEGVQL